MATIYKAWGVVLTATRTMLTDLKAGRILVATLEAAIPWWGAAVTGTGLTAGTVVVTGKKKPGVKQKEKSAPMVNLFPDLDKGNHNEFNIGCLFAICCQKAKVQGWKAATTAAAWQKIGSRYGLTSGAILQTVAPALRVWYMGPESLHNVAGMRAAMGHAMAETAAVAEAAATAAATAKADKAAGKKPEATQSVHQKQSDGMTRTQQAADDLKWIRRDRAGFLSDLNRRTTSVQKFDALLQQQKEAAAAKAAKAEAKAAKAAA